MNELMLYFIGFFPVMVRISGLVMAAPIIGGRGVPAQVKVGLTLVTTIVLYPVLSVPPAPAAVPAYFAVIIRELLVGLGLGFAATLVFSAIYLAGQLIDVPMGFGMVNVVDPQSGMQVPILAQFQYILAALIFFSVRGHHALFQALAASFALIPMGEGLPRIGLPGAVVEIFASMFYLGVRLSLPLVTGMVLADVALGIIARAVPQVNVFMLEFPAKILLGLLLLLVLVPGYVTVLARVFGVQGELASVLEAFMAAF
ncbi:MAG: flagellar type III secretion system protein FliR [Firmicutes bacterium]|jgi:flagellar biosynthetic protein FliR|nr:flagellar type III secretion system protein FliR [Bacillota bacterium]